MKALRCYCSVIYLKPCCCQKAGYDCKNECEMSLQSAAVVMSTIGHDQDRDDLSCFWRTSPLLEPEISFCLFFITLTQGSVCIKGIAYYSFNFYQHVLFSNFLTEL